MPRKLALVIALVLAFAVVGGAILLRQPEDANSTRSDQAKLSDADLAARTATSTTAAADCGLPGTGAVSIEDANLGFAWRTFVRVDAARTEPAKNTTYSPYSASTALQMLANGADPGTDAELLAALCVRGTKLGDLDRQARRLLFDLQSAKDGAEVRIANGIWTVPPHEPSPRVAEAVRSAFRGELDTFASADQVNAWIEERTKGRIDEVMKDEDVTEDLAMVLANAITFDGTWKDTFDDPEKQAFTTSAGDTVDADMLSDTRQLEWYGTSDPWADGYGGGGGKPRKGEPGEFDAVRIPYGKDGRFAMTLVVPREEQGLDEVLRRLDAATWREMAGKLEEREIIVGLPAVHFEEQHDLKDTLFAAGVPRKTYDDLLKVDPFEPVVISFIRQATFLEVDAKGTRAAAATVVGASVGAGMPTGMPVIADHPYLMVVEDTATGTVLFQSAVRNPTQAGG